MHRRRDDHHRRRLDDRGTGWAEGHGRPRAQRHGWDWQQVLGWCRQEAYAVLGRGGSAEDAAQEAAFRAWRHRDSCQTPGAARAWVVRIARNEALRVAVGMPAATGSGADDDLLG